MVRASLIIASHNEGDSLWKTIQSCVETCVGLDYEIIVADDASWDDLIAQVQQRFPQVRVVMRPNASAPATIFRADVDAEAFTRQGTSPTKDFGARSNNDDVGREVETINNYVAFPGTPSSSTACAPSDDTNQTVRTIYTSDGNIETITAVNADTGDQLTQYLYGTTLATSAIATSNLLSQEIYPDSTGPSDRITHTYNRQVEETSITDQSGTVRQFDRDALARPTQDRVTTLGAGVDGSVRRIERAYDVRGNKIRITSLDNAAVGSGSIVNEVTFEFNDFNQRIDTGQAHDGVVIPGTTPSVKVSHADGSGNTIRPASVTYPNGRTITRNYGTTSSITNRMSQVSSLVDDDSTVLAEYERLGLSTFVQQTSPQPDLRYTLISPTLSIDPATGDIYSGLDRFGRVKDVRWQDVSAGTDLLRIEYGYDRASNRIWRQNPSDPNREHDWLYAYDGLHRLSSADRGQLNTGHTAITDDQFNQCWSLDPTGNWKGFQQDDNADGTADLVQTRTANTVNEITDITNTTGATWATPTYDPNGNSLVQPRPDLGPDASMTGVYDAWNRMTRLVDTNTLDVLLQNQFDGRNFRITVAAGTSPKRHYYFTDNWQCVEERIGTATTPERQHVWGMRYIDDLVLRDRMTGTSTTLNERLYHLADANWNTTAIVDDSGVVQERYEYTPYGVISYFVADFTPRSSSTYDTRYTYTNREWTPIAGLYYFRNRWYDALLGRFSSRDPIGYVDGWNLYRPYFVLGKMDPTGEGIGEWIEGCRKRFFEPKRPPHNPHTYVPPPTPEPPPKPSDCKGVTGLDMKKCCAACSVMAQLKTVKFTSCMAGCSLAKRAGGGFCGNLQAACAKALASKSEVQPGSIDASDLPTCQLANRVCGSML